MGFMTNKTRVILPDGEVGTVTKTQGDEFEITQEYKHLGRGPWIFKMIQCTIISEAYYQGILDNRKVLRLV